MKNFLSSFLGALAAMVLILGGVVIVFIGLMGVLIATGSSKKAPIIEDSSYLVFDLSTNITDAPPLVDWSDLTDSAPSSLQLRNITRAIHTAAHDKKIKGILLVGNLKPEGYGSGLAALREVRQALLDYEETSHNPVRAYLTTVTTKDYYLASAAKELTMDPYGMAYMPGLATEPMYYAGLFEKYGIGVQVTRHGKYKSYIESFTRTSMSPEDREQVTTLLTDIWGSLLSDISKSRGVSRGDIQALVDSEGLIRAEPLRKAKLIDKVAYRDEVIDALKKETGVDSPTDSFRQVSLATYIKNLPGNGAYTGKRIGIVYAEGEIVDGEGDDNEIGGTRFARAIRRYREDDDIKAIVLRVNSPGGSATAAEEIQREIRRCLEAKKPVIVSMGSYAASGGYWISAYSNMIFAEPTTITGSIGVFGIQFDLQKLANDHGITFDSVKTGKFAGMLTISRPKTPEELDVIQRMVDWDYSQFIQKVAEGRHMKTDEVDSIGQGRVWSGIQGVKIHLVDKLGTLGDAIREASKEANLGSDYRISEFPAKKDLAEALKDMFQKGSNGGVLMRPQSGALGQIETSVMDELKVFGSFNDPQGLYARMPLDLNIH